MRSSEVKTVTIFEPLSTHAMSKVADEVLKLRLDLLERLVGKIRSVSATEIALLKFSAFTGAADETKKNTLHNDGCTLRTQTRRSLLLRRTAVMSRSGFLRRIERQKSCGCIFGRDQPDPGEGPRDLAT